MGGMRGVSHVQGDGREVKGVSHFQGDGRGVRGVNHVQGDGREWEASAMFKVTRWRGA